MTITTANLSSLIQRRGDAELPANGHWALHQVSFVGVSNVHDRLQLPVSTGMLSIADPPHSSSLTIVAERDDRSISLTASTVAIHPDGHGLSTWQLTGTLDDGATAHDVDVTMSYHGVRRRSDHAWAWFTGRARQSATPRLLRRRGELTVVLDLLFNAPVRGRLGCRGSGGSLDRPPTPNAAVGSLSAVRIGLELSRNQEVMPGGLP